MLQVFLTEVQLQNLSEYKEILQDSSITTRILKPFWNLVAKLFPHNVAPNVLPLAGLISLIQGWYLTYTYIDLYPSTVSILALLLIFGYQTLDGIAPIHAKATLNEFPLVILFKEVCDTVGCVFLIATLCEIVGFSHNSAWYCIQAAQLLFLQQHLKALGSNVMRYRLFAGPGEALTIFMTLICIRAVFGLKFILDLYASVIALIEPSLSPLGMPEGIIRFQLTLNAGTTLIQAIYYILYVYTIITAIFLPSRNYISRNGVILCLLYRVVPSLFFHYVTYSHGNDPDVSLQAVIADGLFMSIITSDVILSRMAKRDLHPWVVIFSMVSLFNYFLIIVLLIFYYPIMFYEICNYTSLPLLTICRNVYVDGVFDLCHIGHKNLFKNALLFGNRLLVGVVGDEDATPYKRKPIMTTEERVNEVKGCKNVHVVIPNAPCFGITKSFIKKHNIHVVAHSVEYDREDDKYYAEARKMGITKTLPRTEGLSTSELIRRVKEYDATAWKKK